MRFFKASQRLTLLIIIAVSIAITYTAYLAIKGLVAEQSRLQQQSMSPVFSLVYEEVLRPLQIAQTISKAEFFTSVMNQSDIDKAAMVEQLKQLESSFGLVFFTASEKARTQYFSNGNTLELQEGKVYWYFEALAQNKDIIADLGNVEDVHLYYDVKVRNKQGEFLGYIGVGRRMQEFISRFEDYKTRFGYDFLFVNDKNRIMLTSIPELVVRDATVPSLETLPWYNTYLDSDSGSVLISDRGQDFLISEIRIEELDWKMMLMIPLQARQAQITRSFVINTVIALALIIALFILAFWLISLYRRHLEKSIEIDQLSGLPNRTYVMRQYHRLRRHEHDLHVVMVDIDRFKQINDTFGHNAGDSVIQEVSHILKAQLRQQDLVGRWGGEEFIILIPNADEEVALRIAERARKELEQLVVHHEEHEIVVTASFGIGQGNASLPLSKILSKADNALYKAKKHGRNRVEIYVDPD